MKIVSFRPDGRSDCESQLSCSLLQILSRYGQDMEKSHAGSHINSKGIVQFF